MIGEGRVGCVKSSIQNDDFVTITLIIKSNRWNYWLNVLSLQQIL